MDRTAAENRTERNTLQARAHALGVDAERLKIAERTAAVFRGDICILESLDFPELENAYNQHRRSRGRASAYILVHPNTLVAIKARFQAQQRFVGQLPGRANLKFNDSLVVGDPSLSEMHLLFTDELPPRV